MAIGTTKWSKSTPNPLHLRIQIPTLNEDQSIASVLQKSLTSASYFLPRTTKVSAVVVDDGSTDQTLPIVRAMASEDKRISILANGRNLGLGYSFRRGANKAIEDGVDFLLHIDGDDQFDPTDIPKLLTPLMERKCDLVTATRFLDPNLSPEGMPKIKVWGNQALAKVISHMTNRPISDASCGFRAFTRQALLALDLKSNFTYTHETLLQIAHRGLSFREVPVKVRGVRTNGRSRMASNLIRYATKSGWGIFQTWRYLRTS